LRWVKKVWTGISRNLLARSNPIFLYVLSILKEIEVSFYESVGSYVFLNIQRSYCHIGHVSFYRQIRAHRAAYSF
jgi:hypothetical protein